MHCCWGLAWKGFLRSLYYPYHLQFQVGWWGSRIQWCRDGRPHTLSKTNQQCPCYSGCIGHPGHFPRHPMEGTCSLPHLNSHWAGLGHGTARRSSRAHPEWTWSPQACLQNPHCQTTEHRIPFHKKHFIWGTACNIFTCLCYWLISSPHRWVIPTFKWYDNLPSIILFLQVYLLLMHHQ